MKKIPLFLCFLILHVDSRPILFEYHNKLFPNGYDFGFSSSDSERSETGQVISSKDEDILNVNGNYSYYSDQLRVMVYFSAGKDGYRPKFSIETLSQVDARGFPFPRAGAARPISPAAIASLAGGISS